MNVPTSANTNNAQEVYVQMEAQQSETKKAARTRRRSHEDKVRQITREHIDELKEQKNAMGKAGWLGFLGGLIGSFAQLLNAVVPGVASTIAEGIEKLVGGLQQLFQQRAENSAIQAQELQDQASLESQQVNRAEEHEQDAGESRRKLQNDLGKILELSQKAQEASVRV